MKVLFIEWASFGKEDMKEAFLEEGHTLICFPFDNVDPRHDEAAEKKLASCLHREAPDVVFSFNYYPVISGVCNQHNIAYISWIYDSPYVLLYSCTVINPCNIIYVFDKEVYMEFHQSGIQTVHYLPMAANVNRLDRLHSAPLKGKQSKSAETFLYDISFVGSLYTEKHNFFERMTTLSDYAKGYLEALMTAQMQIQGYNFIQEALAPVMEDLYHTLPMQPNSDGVETKEYLYAQYVINRKITSLERIALIQAIAQKHHFDLFTHDPAFSLPNLTNHGSVSPYDEMPLIFKQSRINLNISLRSIKSGIPQRAFDIMGSGGFLLSNYQNDFMDDFIPGEDFEFYESKADLLNKIEYYLSHDDERLAIAKNSHDKVNMGHTYRHRVREMLDNIS